MTPWQIEATVDADGTPIFYREVGSGPPVLLLHGFPQTGHCWREVAARLGSGFRVLVPDLPGYGRSGRPPGFDAATLGATLVAFLVAVDAPRAIIVGHDWGGAIAFRIAGAHAEAAERLVVVNSPYRKLDLRRGWYMLAFNIPLLPELMLTATRGRLVDTFLRLGAADAGVFRDSVTVYREAFRPWERRRNAFGYYRTMSRNAFARALPFRRRSGSGQHIQVPTMIVWGEADPVLPVALAEGIARDIPHARLERLPGVGHFVPEEAPGQLADLIAAFGRE